MAEAVTMGDSKAIADKAVYRVVINAPIDKVWAELVKTDEVLPFFFRVGLPNPDRWYRGRRRDGNAHTQRQVHGRRRQGPGV